LTTLSWRRTGTASATSSCPARGPTNRSPTAGCPVAIALGAAAFPAGFGSGGKRVPKDARVLKTMRIGSVTSAKTTWLPKVSR
jgi:hypothetical protein